MADSIVHRNASWEGNTPLNLLLNIFVHVASLPINNKINKYINMIHIHQKLKFIFFLKKEKVNQLKRAHSLMNESPFSQRSTILAFGLQSANTSCKASAKILSKFLVYHIIPKLN